MLQNRPSNPSKFLGRLLSGYDSNSSGNSFPESPSERGTRSLWRNLNRFLEPITRTPDIGRCQVTAGAC
jgi:hypothetical protein